VLTVLSFVTVKAHAHPLTVTILAATTPVTVNKSVARLVAHLDLPRADPRVAVSPSPPSKAQAAPVLTRAPPVTVTRLKYGAFLGTGVGILSTSTSFLLGGRLHDSHITSGAIPPIEALARVPVSTACAMPVADYSRIARNVACGSHPSLETGAQLIIFWATPSMPAAVDNGVANDIGA